MDAAVVVDRVSKNANSVHLLHETCKKHSLYMVHVKIYGLGAIMHASCSAMHVVGSSYSWDVDVDARPAFFEEVAFLCYTILVLQ